MVNRLIPNGEWWLFARQSFISAACYSALRKTKNSGRSPARAAVSSLSTLACEVEAVNRTECAKAERRKAARSGVDVQAESPLVPEGYLGG